MKAWTATAVMQEQYDKTCSQGKRNDISRELEILTGGEATTSGHNGLKLNSREKLAQEYGLSGRNAARYLRLDKLIRPYKNVVDSNKIAFSAAVDVSYLADEEQEILYSNFPPT